MADILTSVSAALEVAELDLSSAILGISPEILGLEIFQQKQLVIVLAACQHVPRQEVAGLMATPQQMAQRAEFMSMWKQVSDECKAKPTALVFPAGPS